MLPRDPLTNPARRLPHPVAVVCGHAAIAVIRTRTSSEIEKAMVSKFRQWTKRNRRCRLARIPVHARREHGILAPP